MLDDNMQSKEGKTRKRKRPLMEHDSKKQETGERDIQQCNEKCGSKTVTDKLPIKCQIGTVAFR